MLQSVLFGLFGIAVGLALVVFAPRAARLLRASRAKVFGEAAGRMVSVTFLQVIGVFFVIVGGFMVFLALSGRA